MQALCTKNARIMHNKVPISQVRPSNTNSRQTNPSIHIHTILLHLTQPHPPTHLCLLQKHMSRAPPSDVPSLKAARPRDLARPPPRPPPPRWHWPSLDPSTGPPLGPASEPEATRWMLTSLQCSQWPGQLVSSSVPGSRSGEHWQ